MNIEVILREAVPNLGKAGELVKVKPGYARNFLFPRNLAYEATEANKKKIAAEAKAKAARASAEKGEAEALKGRLEALKVTVTGKAGDEGKLFGSITAQDVADAVAAHGITLDKRKLALEHPIKTVGYHTVDVRLHPEVHAELRVQVVAG